MAAIQATTFAADLGFMHVVSEGDSLTVIKKLTSPNEDRWKISGGGKDLLKKLNLLLSNVTYIHRIANIVAHPGCYLHPRDGPFIPDVATVYVDGDRRGVVRSI